MKTNRLDKRRKPNFQALEPRLALDADPVDLGVLVDGQVAESETVDLSFVDDDVNEFGILAFSSMVLTDATEEFEVGDVGSKSSDLLDIASFNSAALDVELQDVESREFELQDIKLMRSDDHSDEEIDVSIMSFGGLQLDFDTNNDGMLAAADALLVINALNARNMNQRASVDNIAAASLHGQSEMNLEFDINRDGMLSPIDALLVINALNSQANLGSENLATENSSMLADARPDDMSAETTEAAETIESATMARMMQMAGATEVKISGNADFETIVLSFDSEGKVAANSGAEGLEVTFDENNAISIEGIAVPVALATIGDTQQFVPYQIEDDSLKANWPWAFDVDNVFAFL